MELAEIAEAHGQSVPQVILRWLVQRGVALVAKSTHAERLMTDNAPRLTLNNGVTMPSLGFGVFQSSPRRPPAPSSRRCAAWTRSTWPRRRRWPAT